LSTEREPKENKKIIHFKEWHALYMAHIFAFLKGTTLKEMLKEAEVDLQKTKDLVKNLRKANKKSDKLGFIIYKGEFPIIPEKYGNLGPECIKLEEKTVSLSQDDFHHISKKDPKS